MLTMQHQKIFNPLTWPVLSFAAAILLGAALLCLPACWLPGKQVGWLDALFLSTSAVCVTGLATLDIGTTFNRGGLSVLLALIQLGGLGITTYSSLIFVLWRNRVPFTDRQAVSQALLNKDVFDLRAFVVQIVGLVLLFEGVAATLLWLHDPVNFHPFSAVFHAVSAFCNAGFGLLPDNLMSFRDDVAVNLIIGSSIVFGGLGFAVLRELVNVCMARARQTLIRWTRRLRRDPDAADQDNIPPAWRYKHNLDRYSRMVIKTSAFLILGGGLFIYIMESVHALADPQSPTGVPLLLASFFQSISARTAGFNTVDMTTFTDTSLLALIGLMFIGGSPGSCAGGIKTTTFRVLVGYLLSQLRGDRQIVISQRAVHVDSLNRALALFFFTALTICGSVVLLSITENGFTRVSDPADIPMINLLFEVVSALGTVGLSMNLTPQLSDPGKGVIILNMFFGRVGFITLLAALQSLRPIRPYAYPSVDMPIG